MLWSELVRRLVTQFNGYECKEPERGKFTLVFKEFKDSVGFAVTIQSALLELDYPPELLKAEEFMELRLEEDNVLLYRGLRAKIGMAHGRWSLKKPIQSTGRADYYGILPNTAASLMSMAPAGQILTDGTYLHEMLDVAVPPVASLLKKGAKAYSFRRMSYGSLIEAVKEGMSIPHNLSQSGTTTNALFPISATTRYSGSETRIRSGGSCGSYGSGGSGGEEQCNRSRFDHSVSQFELELATIDTAAGPVCSVIAQSYGMFSLEGVPEPKPLVQLSLRDLRARSVSTPRSCFHDNNVFPADTRLAHIHLKHHHSHLYYNTFTCTTVHVCVYLGLKYISLAHIDFMHHYSDN
jgi:hypothetical protein